MTLVYQVEPEVYLDRQRRMLRARGKVDGHLDPQEVVRILAEVASIPLVRGRRYRFRVLGGAPTTQHFHAVEVATGRHVVGDIPDVREPEWIERSGRYLGRGTGPWSASHLFLLGDGQLAALADIDILRIEEVGS